MTTPYCGSGSIQIDTPKIETPKTITTPVVQEPAAEPEPQDKVSINLSLNSLAKISSTYVLASCPGNSVFMRDDFRLSLVLCYFLFTRSVACSSECDLKSRARQFARCFLSICAWFDRLALPINTTFFVKTEVGRM